jgi:hypothetical protein
MKKQFIVEVSDDGDIRIETRGFEGSTCLEEAQFLKDLLGHEISRQLTPAYYNQGRKIIKKHLPLCGLL